nr:hypothetical protein [Pandoravirus aubagnensis]
MDVALGGAMMTDTTSRERLVRRRRLLVVRWWPCWTVVPALLTALLVFVPWYTWDLAPDYDLAGRARRASCLVLAHATPLTAAGSDLVIPRLYVRLSPVADNHAIGDHNHYDPKRHVNASDDKSTQTEHLDDDVETWAMPFLTERDSYMDNESALAFLAASPVGARRACFYDPVAPTGAHVAMDNNVPSLFRRLCLVAWSAAVAAVSAMAVCFGLISRWAAL